MSKNDLARMSQVLIVVNVFAGHGHVVRPE